MISIKNLCKSYQDTIVYDNFSLDIEEGGVLAVLGESGCGKTTLLNVLAGLTDCKGEVPSLRSSYVFQSPRLVPNLTGLSGLGGRYPAQLSGGQAQRVALCRAFLFPSELMLLDEPFSSLDLKLKIAVMQVFLKLREARPVTTVFVTHDIDEALYLSDRIVVLKGGSICGDIENARPAQYGGNSAERARLTGLLID